ncbi:hypothetical protein MMC22_011566 [Lobaria immixta]|nr:hypothetical protein [Lobaria immixta]
MRELQRPKLENFIPRDLLEHIRLLRSNFAKINLHIEENPVGAVPNFYYNVLSQQYMDLSEKLLAPPTEDELTALEVRARVHMAAQLDLGVAAHKEEEEEEEEGEEEKEGEEENKEMVDFGGRREVVQDEGFSSGENTMDDSSSLQKNAVDIPNYDLIPGQPREEAGDCTSLSETPSSPEEKATVVPSPTRSPIQSQQDAVNVKDSHAGRSQSQELEISSIPLDIDLENNLDKEIHVAIPALASRSTSTDRSTPEIPLEAYGVEMLNVQTTYMRIGTKAKKSKVLKKLISANQARTSTLRDSGDIKYIEWISNDAPKKVQSTIILEFRTPEQANEVIQIGLDWHGFTHHCRKYARNCKHRQCTVCQAYGHGENQCTSLPRCMNCGGQHSASQCSSEIAKCALCGGGHYATSILCPRLAAERNRVSDALLNRSHFWPVQGTAQSRAAQEPIKSASPQISLADRLLSTRTKNTVLPSLSYEGFLSQSKATWPTVWHPQDTTKSEKFGTGQLKSGTPQHPFHPSAEKKAAKKALKAVSGNQPKVEETRKTNKRKEKRKSPSIGQQDREDSNTTRSASSPKKPTAALAISQWSAVASDEKGYW